jgi:hypothetical protein
MKFFHILAVVAVLPAAAMAEETASEVLTVGPYEAAEIGDLDQFLWLRISAARC